MAQPSPTQICSAGDAQFFDTSRALGVIGIVASQSIEAYVAAIGNEHAATALLGNFANVVAFRSTERTMNYVAGKLGEVDVWKETYNTGRRPTDDLLPEDCLGLARALRVHATPAASHCPDFPRPRLRPGRRTAHRRWCGVRRRALGPTTHRRDLESFKRAKT